MRRLAQLLLVLTFCCAYGAQAQAAPAPDGKQTAAAPKPGDLRYIAEDPALAKLVSIAADG